MSNCVSVVLSQNVWSVTYTTQSVCTLKGSTVEMSCTYTYPSGTVTTTFWFLTNNAEGNPVSLSDDPDYKGRVMYHRDKKNGHTLTITDLRESDSATYMFSFITDQTRWRYTGSPGVTLSVTGNILYTGSPGVTLSVTGNILYTGSPGVTLSVTGNILYTGSPGVTLSVTGNILYTGSPGVSLSVTGNILYTGSPGVSLSVTGNILYACSPGVTLSVTGNILHTGSPGVTLSVTGNILYTGSPGVTLSVTGNILYTGSPGVTLSVTGNILYTGRPGVTLSVTGNILYTGSPGVTLSVTGNILYPGSPGVTLSVTGNILYPVSPGVTLSVTGNILYTGSPGVTLSVTGNILCTGSPGVTLSVTGNILYPVSPGVTLSVTGNILYTGSPGVTLSVTGNILYTGSPGVTLSVTGNILYTVLHHVTTLDNRGFRLMLSTPDLQVKVTPYSRMSTWKRLTCSTTSCPLTGNPTYIWYKNGQVVTERTLPYSVLPNAVDSYFCAVKDHEDLHSPAVCVQGQSCYRVTYTKRRICALKGSTVDISCTYVGFYNTTSSFWFRSDKSTPEDLTTDPGYEGRVEYTGTYRGPFTLRITDLREEDSAEYRFTFKTDNFDWGHSFPGTTLTVTDLQVKVTPGTVTEGSWVTLTCSTTCTLTEIPKPTYIWYMNGEYLFSDSSSQYQYSVSRGGSDSYSCALRGHDKLSSPEVTVGECCDLPPEFYLQRFHLLW
uniref:Ig-like domain-containing protein n=1 Tax=Oncorhynchus mykiss TaxID=8022 RepID=A0A8K9URA8_ONCMY